MKVLAKSRKGDMLKLQDDAGGRWTWYFMSPAVQNYAKTAINAGDTVSITSEPHTDGKSQTITRIEKTGSAPPQQQKPGYTPAPGGDDKSESIKRQAVLKAVCSALPALAGQVVECFKQ